MQKQYYRRYKLHYDDLTVLVNDIIKQEENLDVFKGNYPEYEYSTRIEIPPLKYYNSTKGDQEFYLMIDVWRI